MILRNCEDQAPHHAAELIGGARLKGGDHTVGHGEGRRFISRVFSAADAGGSELHEGKDDLVSSDISDGQIERSVHRARPERACGEVVKSDLELVFFVEPVVVVTGIITVMMFTEPARIIGLPLFDGGFAALGQLYPSRRKLWCSAKTKEQLDAYQWATDQDDDQQDKECPPPGLRSYCHGGGSLEFGCNAVSFGNDQSDA